MNPLQVRHVREALHRQFDGKIDLSDCPHSDPGQREQTFLSRALAALAVKYLTGSDADEAAQAVIDGFDDCGIDAIGISSKSPHLWLVQAKWSDKGEATFNQNAALNLKQGFDYLLEQNFSRFNAKFQAMADEVDAVLGDADIQITLVVALAGKAEVGQRPHNILNDICTKTAPMTDIRVIGLPEFHKIIRTEIGEPKVNLEVRLEGCAPMHDPYQAYYGTISAGAVADWYDRHGDRLFSKNIRKSLGLTKVNRSIVETLLKEPEHFWYYNNGITVLSDSVRRKARYAMRPAGPGEFVVDGASVVNGAQTVVAIHNAVKQAPEIAENGRVWVRLISLEHCPQGFARSVTRATNTQNQVEVRDYASLDPRQSRLREDFLLSLGKTYTFKRGDVEPAPENGCSIVEAAQALACAHRNPDLAMRARQNKDLLWESGPQGTYEILFGPEQNAYQVWNAVRVMRAVLTHLEKAENDLDGRASQVARQGDLLIAHIVLQQIPRNGQAATQVYTEEVLERVPEMTREALEWLILHTDNEYGPTSYILPTFKHQQRCKNLAEKVLASIQRGEPRPALPAGYSPSRTIDRRARAVAVIVTSGVISDGTPVEFRPATGPERRTLSHWIADDPRRGRATWVNDKKRPLLWEADGKQHSPSGLVKTMLEMAGKKSTAVQGTTRWFIPGRGSLAAIADELREADVIASL